MTHSPKDIEAEVEAHRSKLAGGLDELRDRMAPERVLDGITQFVNPDDARHTLHAAARQVRAHPVAFGLIAAGLALLATRGQRDAHHNQPHPHDRDNHRGYEGHPLHPYTPQHDTPHMHSAPGDPLDHPTTTGRAKEIIHSAMDTASDTVHGLAQGAKGYLHQGQDKVGTYGRAAAEHLHAAQDGVARAYEQSRDTVRDLGQQASHHTAAHPLAVGAAALAAGAIVGAALPRTRTEDAWMGPLHDRLAEETHGLAKQARETAGEAVHAAYAAAVDTAKEEGLLPTGDKTLAERVEHVATTAAEEAKHKAQGTQAASSTS